MKKAKLEQECARLKAALNRPCANPLCKSKAMYEDIVCYTCKRKNEEKRQAVERNRVNSGYKMRKKCASPWCTSKAINRDVLCYKCKHLPTERREEKRKSVIENLCKTCGFRYHPYGDNGKGDFQPDYCSVKCAGPQVSKPEVIIPAYVPPPPRNYFRNYNYHASQPKSHPWLVAAREALAAHDAKIESEGNS